MPQHSSIENERRRPAPWFEIEAPIAANRQIVGSEFELSLYAPEIAACAQPGQFVMLVFGEGYSRDVRRPFSMFDADPESGAIRVIYRARGSFTTGLSQMHPGEPVRLVGPLGTPFRWRTGEFMSHILVAGGFGAPPIHFLAREICRWSESNLHAKASIHAINGAQSVEMLVGGADFERLPIELSVITADGSAGQQGLVTDVLQRKVSSHTGSADQLSVYACGPMAMLQSVAAICVGVSCQVSIETAMPCGVGQCDDCGVRILDSLAAGGIRTVKACSDGPVFEAGTLVWDVGV